MSSCLPACPWFARLACPWFACPWFAPGSPLLLAPPPPLPPGLDADPTPPPPTPPLPTPLLPRATAALRFPFPLPRDPPPAPSFKSLSLRFSAAIAFSCACASPAPPPGLNASLTSELMSFEICLRGSSHTSRVWLLNFCSAPGVWSLIWLPSVRSAPQNPAPPALVLGPPAAQPGGWVPRVPPGGGRCSLSDMVSRRLTEAAGGTGAGPPPPPHPMPTLAALDPAEVAAAAEAFLGCHSACAVRQSCGTAPGAWFSKQLQILPRGGVPFLLSPLSPLQLQRSHISVVSQLCRDFN